MPREIPDVEDVTRTIIPNLGERDAGDDQDEIPPRGWLLGNTFCRRFISSVIGDGGVGKTALRIAQALSLASGRSLTGEHVFKRCKVLLVSLEDDVDELRRRVRAAMLYHGVTRAEVKGWLYLAAPGAKAGKLAVIGDKGRIEVSTLGAAIEEAVGRRGIDLVCLDPFVKAHSVEENGNSAIDDVMQLLSDMAAKRDIAIDAPHHQGKGPADPGNANRSRGASSMVAAARLVNTLTPMSREEAQAFGIAEAERRLLIRLDSAKVNIAPPMTEAKWFRLVGVRLGNATALYPNGDEVQTVEVWTPPDVWAGISGVIANQILDLLEAGTDDGDRYSDHNAAADRAAWRVVLRVVPGTPEGQAKTVIATWVRNGVLERRDYTSPTQRKPRKGLFVNPVRRPS
jgi:hypothetical protein